MQNSRNPLIFIIEDSPIYKDLIVGYLNSKSFKNIKTFKSGDECMASIPLKPDVIILDYTTGGISGSEFMRKVSEKNPEIDFIFISGQNDVEVAVKLMKLGAADYIVKNEKAPYNLVKSIEYLRTETKSERIKKGFKIGVVGFFIMLFLIIMIVILMTIFLDDFNF